MTSRVGQVWEHMKAGNIHVIIWDDLRFGPRGRCQPLEGWASLDLTDGCRLDWLPDSCFTWSHWRRIA